MSPITHGLLGWLLGNCADIGRRGRVAVTLAGIAPDIDGFGWPFEVATRGSEHPLDWFHRYHHVLAHNLAAVAAIALVAWVCCRRSWRVAGLSAAAALLHLLCDLAGSRSPAQPDGTPSQPWPITWFWPVDARGWAWDGQWQLASWQNLTVTLTALAVAIAIALRAGRSPVEVASARADAAVVEVLRRRLGCRVA